MSGSFVSKRLVTGFTATIRVQNSAKIVRNRIINSGQLCSIYTYIMYIVLRLIENGDTLQARTQTGVGGGCRGVFACDCKTA